MGIANTKIISETSKNKTTHRIKKPISKSSHKKTLNCTECRQPTIDVDNSTMISGGGGSGNSSSGGWCNSCNAKRFRKDLSNWTSGNSAIDDLIKESQMN